MKQQSLEKFEYSEKDIEKLIYEDICKQCSNPSRARVDISFNIGYDTSDNDYLPRSCQILKSANVTVDMTK